jgi:transcriptional regulator with XRE-family HTH domain
VSYLGGMSNAQQGARDVPSFELRHRLGLALEHAGVSVQEMAAELEMSRNTIGNYLSGRRPPTASTMKMWALRCGVPYFWIRYGVTDPAEIPDGEVMSPTGRTTQDACDYPRSDVPSGKGGHHRTSPGS